MAEGTELETGGGSAWNIQADVEAWQEAPISEEEFDPKAQAEPDVEEEAEEEAEAGPETPPKAKVKRMKMTIEVIDNILAASMVMLAKEKPSQIAKYKAEESYKDEMAEYMAMCKGSFELKPEWMLVIVALIAYGPLFVQAYQTRKQKDNPKQTEKSSSAKQDDDDDVDTYVVEKDGEAKEVSKEEFEALTKTALAPIKEVRKNTNQCHNCGKPTKNKKFCSRECSLETVNRAKKLKKEESTTVG